MTSVRLKVVFQLDNDPMMLDQAALQETSLISLFYK